jgi:tRNA nucleotidyltransferase (CCA-adding enzyme)
VLEIARAFRDAGGRALVVGGWVRDQLLGRETAVPDIDLEVQGLEPEVIESVLSRFGRVRRVGRAFPIHLVEGLALDVCLPRTGDPGPDGSPPSFDPGLDFAEAARGRDLRVNAMGWDPLSGELLDPHGGRRDIEAGVLRATDPARFGRDPLRGLRVARLAAVLEMQVDDELVGLCAATDLRSVAPERIFIELRKLLLDARAPSRGFEELRRSGLLRFLPELAALIGVPQDAKWHPEGDVWTHNQLCLDVAAGLRVGDAERDLLLMLGVLCHDVGKPGTTEEREGRIVSHAHDVKGVAVTEQLLARVCAPNAVVRGVSALVRHHLAPALYTRPKTGAGPRGYRKLVRRLREAGVDADLLWRVARADHLGRTTEDARTGSFAAGERFLAEASRFEDDPQTWRTVVTGRFLQARGVEPGPELGRWLERCREIQDETGWTDPEAILERARSQPPSEAPDLEDPAAGDGADDGGA